ncbi:IclR family transcriptional regulator [Mycobacterium marseillense]|uniref:IclR family transcriptional regulator n=1 Tax=Mycobacterium marseillense TaxID=701042 RepID=UPI002595CDBF|nr:IclR family transcriptional regulator [Mycobacterium marseillense]MDM3975299.1 IclR family transcriptional regulator [Mycobacterium marseillense]
MEKACRLLTAFGADNAEALGVSELARRAGLTKSTAYRQLNILARAEMVERSGRGYRIGRGLRTLARGLPDGARSHLGDALLPYLVELFEVTRCTVQLAVLEGTEAVYIGKVCGHSSVSVPSGVGSRLPAHCTAGGKLLLAFDPHAAARVLSAPLRRLTSMSVSSAARLQGELRDVRRTGLAFDIGGTNLNVCCVASPISTPDRAAVAAISVCAPRGTNLKAIGSVLERITMNGSRHVRRPALGMKLL